MSQSFMSYRYRPKYRAAAKTIDVRVLVAYKYKPRYVKDTVPVPSTVARGASDYR
jgi:hypothetical protein